MLDLIYSESVRTLMSVAIIPIALTIVFLAVIHIIALLVSARPDVDARKPFKYERYEAGNPPKGEPRKAVTMQYFGYLVMFLALEPVIVLFALTMLARGELASRVLLVYTAILAVFIPFLIYGIRESRRVESWSL